MSITLAPSLVPMRKSHQNFDLLAMKVYPHPVFVREINEEEIETEPTAHSLLISPLISDLNRDHRHKRIRWSRTHHEQRGHTCLRSVIPPDTRSELNKR